MAVRKIPTTNDSPDIPEKKSEVKETVSAEIKGDEAKTIPVKRVTRPRTPAKSKVADSETKTKTPVAKAPIARRRTVAAKAEPTVPAKADVAEITAINDEKLDEVILASEEKPKKSKDKDKKKKKKKKAKAKKEKAKKKAQKKKEKKKAKAKKKKVKKKAKSKKKK